MSNLDDKIREALQDSVKIDPQDKQAIWKNIERELFVEKQKGEIKRMKTKQTHYIPFAAAAVIVVMLFIGAQTETGHAIINQIKEIFVSEKQITQELEGNKEKTDVKLQQPSQSNYVIYVDEERYEFVEGKESDKIIMKNQTDGNYPEVSMEIKQVTDKSPQDVVKELETQIRATYKTVYEAKQVTQPINGWKVRGVDGQQWNSPIINVYVVSNGNQGSFIITQRYFLEAEEGHGVRFNEMVKEFHIVNESLENK